MEIQNIFLLVFYILFILMFAIVGVYFVIFFSHKNEKNFKGQNFIQGVAIFGFSFPILIITLPAVDFLY